MACCTTLRPSKRIIALAAALTVLAAVRVLAGDPADPSRNYLGINVWFNNDYNGANTFVDMIKHSREWRQYDWSAGGATIDSLGWPTQDCSNVIFGQGNPLGTYKLIFEGSATSVSMLWTGGSVTNLRYDAGTNTSTADVTLTNSNTGGLRFQGTRRTAASATNTGIRNVRLYRPGYPTDGSVVYTSEWLAIMRKFHVIRFMDWVYTNANPVVTWAQRQTPFMATRPDLTIGTHTGRAGVAMEHFIQLCNEVNADLWLNFPCMADDDYVRKTAQMILYGSDGTNPYTAPQANPVFPPLNGNLKVCLEWANEVWNTAAGFQCYRWIKETTDAILASGAPHPIKYDGANDQYRAVARFTAWRMAEASKIFREVFGDAAMMTRVRPMLMGQLGGNWCNPAQLPFLDGYYGTYRPAGDPYPNTDPHPVSYYIYASGGSSYYGVNTWDPNPDVFFAAGNYPTASFSQRVGNDAVWGGNYGLKRISYEGGMGLDAGSWSATDQQKEALNADPRMKDLTITYHDTWSQAGGDLAVYYCAVGPVNWEFTDAVTNPNSPKLQAIDKLRDTLPRAGATLGGVAPATVVARAMRSAGVAASVGTFWDGTVSSEEVVSGVDPGEWIALPISAPADGYYLVSARAAAGNTSARATLWLNGVCVDTFQFSGAANTLFNSPQASVLLKRGLNVVRFQPLINQWSLRSVTFVLDSTVAVTSQGVARAPGAMLMLRVGGRIVRLDTPVANPVAVELLGLGGRVVWRAPVPAGGRVISLPCSARGPRLLVVRGRDGGRWVQRLAL